MLAHSAMSSDIVHAFPKQPSHAVHFTNILQNAEVVHMQYYRLWVYYTDIAVVIQAQGETFDLVIVNSLPLECHRHWL